MYGTTEIALLEGKVPFVRKLKVGVFVLIVGNVLGTCEGLLEVGKLVGMTECDAEGINVRQNVGRAIGGAVRKVGKTVGTEEGFERGRNDG